MRTGAFLAVTTALALICYVGGAPRDAVKLRPMIPESFIALTQVVTDYPTYRVTGTGMWAYDMPAGRSFESVRVDQREHRELDIQRLDRYDLGKSWNIVEANMNSTCDEFLVHGALPQAWGWVNEASYEGERSMDGHNYDVWAFKVGYAQVYLAVAPEHPDVPVYLIRESPANNSTTRFVGFYSLVPDVGYFGVPEFCRDRAVKVEPLLGCVGRSTMQKRAQVWVDHRVPYNQGGQYGGYRTDCSGYVSMAWETAKPGYTTFTLPHIAHPISKASLQPGDVLLCTTEHVLIFDGWSGGGKTHFMAFEETRPGEGTVKRVTPYPYWYNTGCFKPYRFNQVC